MKRIVVNPKLSYSQKESSRITNGSTTGNLNEPLSKSSSFAEKDDNEFYSCMRVLLRLGRCLGIVPISGLFRSSLDGQETLEFRWNSFATVTSILILAALAFNAIVNFMGLIMTLAEPGRRNAAEIAIAAAGPIFYLAMLMMCAFFLVKSSKLPTLFASWRKAESELNLKAADTKLPFHINVLVVAVYTSAFVGAAMANLVRISIINTGKNQTDNETEEVNTMDLYYQQRHPFWARYFDYNPILTSLLLIVNVLCFLTWNYADVVIIAFARALCFKFRVLVEETEKRLIPSKDNPSVYILRGLTWTDVRKDHMTLCKLLDELESFLSPLIFLSYSINIFLLSLQIQQGLTPIIHRTFMESVIATWSFFHLIFRTMAISLTASKINDYAHQIAEPIQKCASRDYCREVERLERMLGTTVLGLSGLGCFIVTRAFILVVVSVIFTMEIVFLQANAA